MNSQLTDDFLKCFRRLPKGVQEQARRSYRLWRNNPSHPGLHFKPIQGQTDVYSVRIGIGWRGLGVRDGNTITWFWIGSHADYDSLIS